jgi:hypothetical protein
MVLQLNRKDLPIFQTNSLVDLRGVALRHSPDDLKLIRNDYLTHNYKWSHQLLELL